MIFFIQVRLFMEELARSRMPQHQELFATPMTASMMPTRHDSRMETFQDRKQDNLNLIKRDLPKDSQKSQDIPM